MAVVKGEHDPEWIKFFIAVAPIKKNYVGGFVILGSGTFDECWEDVLSNYDVCIEYQSPARLVCFTGGIVEIVVRRFRKSIFMGKEKLDTRTLRYTITLERIPPTQNNPYGLSVAGVKQEELKEGN